MRKNLMVFVLIFLASPAVTANTLPLPPRFDTKYGAYSLGEDELVDDAAEGGMSYNMRQYRWGQLEIAQDVFRFDEIDEWYYGALEPNGVGAILILRTGQCWATDNSYDPDLGIPLPSASSAPPLEYGDYYDFIYRVVDHFRGDIEQIIIENDPLTKHQWYGTPEEYKQLTAVAYQAAKDANPRCVVIGNKFPAMSFGYLIASDLVEEGKYEEALDFWNGYHSRRHERWQAGNLAELTEFLTSDFSLWAIPFADAILEPDQAGHLDALGFNYYLHYDYIDDVVGWLTAQMQKNGYSRHLIDLEHGVKDERSVVNDNTAAQELVKGYAITHSLGVEYVSWYPFTLDTLSHNFENLKLMYDYANAQFFPAYYAMRTFAGHCTPRHRFQSKGFSSFERYSFENKDSQLVDLDIVWSDAGDTTVAFPFRPSFRYAIVTSYLGDSADTLRKEGDSITLSIKRAPKLIQWKKSLGLSHHEPGK
jgi:hypothetical protein